VQDGSDSGEPVGVVAKPQEPRSSSLRCRLVHDPLDGRREITSSEERVGLVGEQLA
jgi:hypothetical protein